MNELSGIPGNKASVVRTSRLESEANRVSSDAAANGQFTGRKVPEKVEQAPVEPARQVAAEIAQQIERAVSSLNDYARSIQRELEFSIDNELGRPIVQVIDQRTKEVIRQIPNDVTLNLARNLQSNLEQLDLQRAAQQAGVEQFVSVQANSGLVNTLV
jgi:flagellar protein FlaG